MNKDQLGNKHLCSSCGIKFYDLKKEIPLCPKCNTEIIVKVKPRLGRPPLNKKLKKETTNITKKTEKKVTEENIIDEETDLDENIDNLVSLEDIENTEEEISDTEDDIDIITENNNEENITEITDLEIINKKGEE